MSSEGLFLDKSRVMLRREEFCYDTIRIIISRLLDDAVELDVLGCRLTY